MATLNFPNTLGQPTDGSFTYIENNVIYSWNGTYWSANNATDLDNRYVNVTGDTMTGDLTVPNLESAGDVTAVDVTASGDVVATGDIESTSQNGGQLSGFRNQLINGGMDVWQRATEYNNTSTDAMLYRTVDRWALAGSQTNEGETKRLTSTAGSLTGMPPGFNYAFAYWDAADTSRRSSFSQGIELPESGGNCRGAGPFTPGSQWTLSCYCSADITSVQARMDFSDDVQNVNAVSFGAAANWVQIEAPTATSWGRYAVTFTGSSNDFNTTTRCMRVVIGSIGKQPTPAQFTTESSRVGITGCQLEPGPVATPFEHRPIGTELALCQRYYQTVSRFRLYTSNNGSGSTNRFFELPRAVVMRTDPTETSVTTGMTFTGTADAYHASGQAPDINSGKVCLSYTADAEL